MVGDADYEAQRTSMVWNARKPPRFPDAIVNVIDPADAAAAVRFAREHGLKVGVRGGGHHYNGTVLRQGGLLLDLSGLGEVQILPRDRRAVVQPGVIGSALQSQLTAHRLAFPVGHCPTVRLSGFLLNGGMGWNALAWGLGCQNVLAAEVITADGESVLASEKEHADLFWAARGAGPGFPGIVTRWHLNLHTLSGAIRTSTLCFGLEHAEAAMNWLMEGVGRLPVQSDLFVVAPLPRDFARLIGVENRQAMAFVATVFADSDGEARSWLAPFKSPRPGLRPLLNDHCRDTPFPALYALINAAFPQGLRLRADDMHTNIDAPKALGHLRESIHSAPGPYSNIQLFFGPPPSANGPPLPDMAVYLPPEASYVGIYGYGQTPADDAAVDAWVQQARLSVQPFDMGSYVGEADLSEGNARARQCFTPPAWMRLTSIRARRDPHRLFNSFDDYRS
ncbi:MAG TPA: FAD-binding oxidoreductase [Steroidobacteraceae bacterium]|nr:FAD-binding oxidoreductase [Steroidobacteraceae bacterium]